ncbi:MAG: hypothetical protein QG657_2451, partial [Acidobacteriota bacterium]|nr:hypothetical protein [Acidobacteriota bacterium]
LTSDSKIDVECRDAQGRDQAGFRGIGRMVFSGKQCKRRAERGASHNCPDLKETTLNPNAMGNPQIFYSYLSAFTGLTAAARIAL